MYKNLVFAVVVAVLLVPSAFCWEYRATFDTDEGAKYFDNDTGAGTSVAPSGGVLSVAYPNYAAFSWRYVFVDKDATNPDMGPNLSFPQGGSVQAKLSYTGMAPTFAFFFLAGGGNAGDDLIYISGAQGGSQTFWGTAGNPLTITPSMQWTAKVDFNTSNFSVFDVGPQHNTRRGTSDSWATTMSGVDAFGVALGYFGNPGSSTLNIDEFVVTPEPSLLLLGGPLAGFLGWRIRRRSRAPAKA